MSFAKPLACIAALFSLILLGISVGNSPAVSGEFENHLQDQRQEILAAYDAGLETQKQFDAMAKFINASGDDIKWREIPWLPSIWEGIKLAEQKQKPIFLWAMNGDPLGCV